MNRDISETESFLLEKLKPEEVNLDQGKIISFISSKLNQNKEEAKNFSKDFLTEIKNQLDSSLENEKGSYADGLKAYNLLLKVSYFLNENTFYQNKEDYPIKNK